MANAKLLLVRDRAKLCQWVYYTWEVATVFRGWLQFSREKLLRLWKGRSKKASTRSHWLSKYRCDRASKRCIFILRYLGLKPGSYTRYSVWCWISKQQHFSCGRPLTWSRSFHGIRRQELSYFDGRQPLGQFPLQQLLLHLDDIWGRWNGRRYFLRCFNIPRGSAHHSRFT